MGTFTSRQSDGRHLAGGVLLMIALAATGCQVNVGGQTLPSPYYLSDDVQYFAPGPEFPLAREAAAAAVRKAEVEALEDDAQPQP
ncbi:MAG: hypothetical protein GTO53_09555 [Planctomycetales bacterium]|nr:hypothetical protein [Planctomycetales bacterium]NIM09371.1 hypothetical protein [Planctomycetales bacterium]NIN08838.1 hypothetical protein [Planctomycetales bacterium]NIN77955.1 hypothetical protein [Planctomycetales bacterium]NIO35138.1 hypothetical protein [Planctomycetales bacterium]